MWCPGWVEGSWRNRTSEHSPLISPSRRWRHSFYGFFTRLSFDLEQAVALNIKGLSSFSPFKLSSTARVVTQFFPLCREGSGSWPFALKGLCCQEGQMKGRMNAAMARSKFSIPLYWFLYPATLAIPHQLKSFRRLWWRLSHTQSTIPRPFFGWLLIMNNGVSFFFFPFHLKLYSETLKKRSLCNWFGVEPKKLFIYFKILSDK